MPALCLPARSRHDASASVRSDLFVGLTILPARPSTPFSAVLTLFGAQVTHTMSGMICAAKIMDVTNKSDLEEFVIEVDALTELKHPNIVSLHAAYYYNNQLWMILDYCAGGAFDDVYLERDAGLTEAEIKCVANQVAKSLSYIHQHGKQTSRSCCA